MRKLIIYFLFLINFDLICQDVIVPIDVQMSILSKLIYMEKKLSKKIEDKKTINVLILYQNKNRQSLNEKNEILNHFSNSQENSFEFSDLIYNNDNLLSDYCRKNKPDIIIVTSLRTADIKAIGEISGKNQSLTFSVEPDNVEKGLSIGVELVRDKPQILINIEQIKNEGSIFSSHLLKIAKILEHR